MTQPLNFQSIIMTLQNFWAEQGCLIWQPYYTQIGAGTMNPATYLRVLGPEPWKVGYVEPSIRPDDGRYGKNPNRMQMHYQFQVILKPDPGNPQEIYLKSLQALGIDAREHDIRFVEDNWEQPALGAWGLGWEVWLDGQEITQFTYFQQAGGFTLDPVSVEITYGLERIAIALQRVESFLDIQWSPSLTDGDVNLQAEQEQCTYYFQVADVDRLRGMYDLFEAEAQACLSNGLVLPAHDYVLKCSHTFNVLDTRGAVGVTDRQAFFRRMRELSRNVAQAYLEQRQQLEYPWLDDAEAKGNKGPKVERDGRVQESTSMEKVPFLLEIGTEELPSADLENALEQLRNAVPDWLGKTRLQHGEIKVMGTPRRLVVYVQELASMQSDIEQVVKGPPADRAFDADGKPTRAAEGFARGKGVAVSDLKVEELDGGRYVTALVRQAGQPAIDILAEALPKLIASISFKKAMRWNSTNVAFSRPIRWILSIHGETVVPFEFAGLNSGNRTRGLRFEEPVEFPVKTPEDFFSALKSQGILLDSVERQESIRSQINALAADVDCQVLENPALLLEVSNLVEAPAALLGSYDPSHLELPVEVLVSVMKKHQRYFPVVFKPDQADTSVSGMLAPYFIVVRNGDDRGMDLVKKGNEHVIRARFADADYFVSEDKKASLESYLPKLDTLTFQVDLGSMLDKTHRIESLVIDLASKFGFIQDEIEIAQRAAKLCKADLATQMVVEMTSLQGQMGRYYALNSGEPEPVANAIFEHYLPRFAGDISPTSRPGLAVGIADRLDSLAGLFAAGLAPSGSKDPFALRRAAVGLVQNMMKWDLDFDLRAALDAAAGHLPIAASIESQASVLKFISERMRNVMLDRGNRYDIVDAVLTAQAHNPALAAKAVDELTIWVTRSDWNLILPAYARCVRITRDLKERYLVEEAEFVEDPTRELFAALRVAEMAPRSAGSVDDFLNAFLPMITAIDSFFDDVLVMTDDALLRKNRLGILQRIAALADGIADLSRLEGF